MATPSLLALGSPGWSIIRAIVNLAISLEIDLVAEGVELHGHADALEAMGCHVMQGYLYAKPMPLAQLRQMLAEGVMPVH